MKCTALGEGVMTNIALGFATRLSPQAVYFIQTGGSTLSNKYIYVEIQSYILIYLCLRFCLTVWRYELYLLVVASYITMHIYKLHILSILSQKITYIASNGTV